MDYYEISLQLDICKFLLLSGDVALISGVILAPMSAFLQSGRSDALKSTKSKVRFRPRLCKNSRSTV
ncbi:protein of unknown function [uncultured Woeseiaceae bacterium]|uniref:Uncharacterized protein n=1 Tax=uncultured Woeseiaceae bacterium TaxID=1983305 RepID=A0A7D9H6P7_9GAMM|nr:protein of unknown function [uncultured Woeseiaceae bacterium]